MRGFFSFRQKLKHRAAGFKRGLRSLQRMTARRMVETASGNHRKKMQNVMRNRREKVNVSGYSKKKCESSAQDGSAVKTESVNVYLKQNLNRFNRDPSDLQAICHPE